MAPSSRSGSPSLGPGRQRIHGPHVSPSRRELPKETWKTPSCPCAQTAKHNNHRWDASSAGWMEPRSTSVCGGRGAAGGGQQKPIMRSGRRDQCCSILMTNLLPPPVLPHIFEKLRQLFKFSVIKPDIVWNIQELVYLNLKKGNRTLDADTEQFLTNVSRTKR